MVAVEVVVASVLHGDQPHDEQVGRSHEAAHHPDNGYDQFELVFRHPCSRTQRNTHAVVTRLELRSDDQCDMYGN